MNATVAAVTWFVLGYFVLMNLGYLVLNLLSLASLYRGLRRRVLDDLPHAFTGMEPPVTVLMPEPRGIPYRACVLEQTLSGQFEVLSVKSISMIRPGTMNCM